MMARPYTRQEGRLLGPEFWEQEIKKVSPAYRAWAAAIAFFQFAPLEPRGGVRVKDDTSWVQFRRNCMTSDIRESLSIDTLIEESKKFRLKVDRVVRAC